MSSFGSGSTTTAGASITLRNFTGMTEIGTDGLVPGPGIGQAGYVLGAGGDWTLDVLEINDFNATNRIATTAFVQNRVAQIVAGGGGIVLGGIQDVDLAGLADDQLLQYNLADLEWQPVTLTLSLISMLILQDSKTETLLFMMLPLTMVMVVGYQERVVVEVQELLMSWVM